MHDWRQFDLGDVASINIGGTPSRIVPEYWAEDFNDGFPWVSIADLKERIQSKTSERITKLGVQNSNVKLVKKGSVLMSFKLSLGRVAFAGSDLYTNEAIAAFEVANDKLIDEYLYYALPEAVAITVTDTAVKGATLNKEKLKNISLCLPPVKQQQKIAHILTTVDNLIEKTQALIDKYTAVKQGMMHDLFTRGIDLATGQLRPSYEQAPELYKETELGWVPREWGVVTIADFASDDKNAIVDGPFGSNLKTEHYRKSGVPVIQSGFVTSNRFQANEYLYVDNEKFISEIRSKVLPGDIVMAKIGAQCGTCAMLPEGHPVGILAGNCLKITVGKDNSKEFLEALLHYYKFIGRLDLVVTTTAQPAVSMSSLKKMKIKRPELAEQNMIMNDIYSIDSVIDREKRAEGHFLELKKGLMQDLLTGRVRVMQGVSNGE